MQHAPNYTNIQRRVNRHIAQTLDNVKDEILEHCRKAHSYRLANTVHEYVKIPVLNIRNVRASSNAAICNHEHKS